MGAEAINTLEINVQRKSGANWPIVVEYSQADVLLPIRSDGVFELSEEARQELTGLLGQPRDYGNRLGQALFRESVRDAFVCALRESEDQLRVLLCIEAEDLRPLRWERLGAPIDNGWGLLAQDQRTPFSLYIPSTTDRRFPPIGRRDQRALLLVASPKDSDRYRLAPFDVKATVASVKAALGKIPCDVLANVDGAIGSPGLDELCARLTDRSVRYTLLHVVCHGRLLGGGETALYWANADNQAEPVTATDLLKRLGTVRGPRGLPHFAFLAACESASPQAEGALEGLAQRLVREVGMPAVLAMTEKVTMKTAAALAEAFYRQLSESGEVDTALPEATAALAKRGDILVPALFSRLGGRPLFSDHLDRELTNEEIQFGLDCLPALLNERAPVLKEEIAAQSKTIAKTLGANATALSRDTREERRHSLETVNTLSQEALDLSFNALALGQRPPDYDARCPFRGLYPFRPEDREFFFGRESLIEQLRHKLAEHNFLPVLGPSGSGKSSLVFAGLIPALQGCEKGLQVVDLTPGNEPLQHLETAKAKLSDPRDVLVVDQFEEVFTLCADRAKRAAFIDKVLGMAQGRRVVLTMRADFWGECAPYKDLKELMEAHQSLIAPMDFAELRNAVDQQAGWVGLRFEAGLSNRILDEVQGEPGAMPLLQHALLELWKRRHGRWLLADEYAKIGAVQKAIARTADDVYDRLSLDEQQQFRNIFVRLTHLDSTAVQGERRRDTRQRVPIEDLLADAEPAVTERLVQRLAGQEARLVVTSVDETTQRETVEVAHEALIRYWPRLRAWLDEDRANYLLREAIRHAAEEWKQHAQEESYLVYSGSRLDDAEALDRRPGFLNTNEQAYVKACKDLRERQEKEKAEAQDRKLEAETKARKAAQTKTRVAYIASAFVLAVTIVSVAEWRQATVGQIEALSAESRALFLSNQQLEGLKEEVLTGKKLVESTLLALWPDTASKNNVNETMTELLSQAREHNRLSIGARVAGVAFAPDDKTLVTWPLDNGKLQCWKADGAPFNPPWLKEVSGGVSAVAFSRDGKIAIAGRKMVAFRNLDEVGSWKTRSVDKGGINAIAFSADGKKIAAATTPDNKEGVVQLWNLDDGSSQTVDGHDMGVPMSVAFSPDGAQIAVTAWNGAFLWRTDGTAEPKKLEGDGSSVNAAAFSPDGSIIATGGNDKMVRLWKSDGTPATKDPLSGHADAVWSLSFRPDGKVVASASSDRTVKLWQIDGTLLATLAGHGDAVRAVAFSHDGKTLASASDDGTVRLWVLGGPSAAVEALIHDQTVYAAAFSPNGRIILTTSGHGWLTLWNQDGTLLTTLRRQYGPITAVAFSPDGKMVATAAGDRTVSLGTIDGGGTLGGKGLLGGQTGETNQTEVLALSFSPDGKMIAGGGVSREVQVWNTDDLSRRPKPLLTTRGSVIGVDFSPDGKNIVVSDESGKVVVVDSESGAQVLTLPAGGSESSPAYGVHYSPNGETIAAYTDHAIKRWTARGKPLSPLLDRDSTFVGFAFSRDGKWIASESKNGAVKIWTADGKLVNTLLGHEGTDGDIVVDRVAFSPDGRMVASANEGRSVILWNWQKDLSLDRSLAHACDWLRDYLTNSREVAGDDRQLCAGVPHL